MHWVDADEGYALALDDGKLVCRNSKGKVLASVPKNVRESPMGEQLAELKDWLAVHARECQSTVERWLLRSLPVPLQALQQIWPDPAWRAPLLNVLVRGQDAAGFLREVGERGIGIVDLDGESQWIAPSQLTLPHPILLENLAEYREILTELQLVQGTTQLFRECWELPSQAEELKSVTDFQEGKFAQMVHAHGRARNLGYPVRGGFACCSIWQDGQVVEARYWVGAGQPDEETFTGDLCWVDAKERALTAAQAGPVAYSEGMRMASQIYAGRVVEKEAE